MIFFTSVTLNYLAACIRIGATVTEPELLFIPIMPDPNTTSFSFATWAGFRSLTNFIGVGIEVEVEEVAIGGYLISSSV